MTNGLQVISPRLFFTHVGRQTGISRRTSEVLTLNEWDMLSFRVLIALRQSEINNVNIIFG